MIEESHTESSWRSTAIGVLTAATIAVLWSVSVYSFGTSDQVVQIPIVLRAMDASYLTNDFFVNANAGFGPRAGFATVMAWLSSMLTVPIAFFVVTVACHVAVSVITYLAARDLLGASHLGALLAVVLILSARYSYLSSAPRITRELLVPALLSMPFALSALWAGLRGRPFVAAVLGLFGAGIHALIGLEAASIAIAASFVGSIAVAFEDSDRPSRMRDVRRIALRHLVAAIGLIGIAYFALIRRAESILSAEEFTGILTFRAPHHYVPSGLPVQEWMLTLVMLALVVWGLWIWVRDGREGSLLRWSVPTVIGALSLMLLGGYIFVEIWPSRLWVTAQTYRMLFILNWLAMVFFADWVASRMERGEPLAARVIAGIGLLGLGIAQAWVMLLAMGGATLVEKVDSAARSRTLKYGALAVGIALPVLGVWRSVDLEQLDEMGISHWMLLLAFLGAAAIAWPLFRFALAVMLLWWTLSIGKSVRELPTVQRDLRQALLGTNSGNSAMDDVSRYTRDNTPEDAILLVPREGGGMRLYGERAVVVDWRGLLFQDSAMREWKRRVDELYWETEYPQIDDARLAELVEEYDADYAVLYIETPTGLDVLYENETYKLVSLTELR